MGFKKGDKVVFNKRYIEKRGFLEYNGEKWYKYHIQAGNPVMIVVGEGVWSDSVRLKGVTDYGNDLFSVDEKEIKKINNSIKRIKE